MEIKTYPEMNKTIKDLLRRSEEPMNLYILARIEELEKQLAEATTDLHFVMAGGDACQICKSECITGTADGCEPYWRGLAEGDPPRDPRSRFERIKACRTPTDMVLLLNGNERRFCPKAYGTKPDECEESCGRCIVQWLEEIAQ